MESSPFASSCGRLHGQRQPNPLGQNKTLVGQCSSPCPSRCLSLHFSLDFVQSQTPIAFSRSFFFASIMATIIPMRNLLSVLKKRFLVTSSVTLSPPTSPLPTSRSSPSFTVQFLVNSCGLPLKSSLSVSKKFQMDEKKLQICT